MKYLLLTALIFSGISLNQVSAQHMMGHGGCSDSLRQSHTGLFLGANHNAGNANTSFTLGIHHEMFARSRTPYFSIGMMGEVAFAGHNEFLGAIPFYFHPARFLKFWIGPGLKATSNPDENNNNNNNSSNNNGHNDSMMGNWQSNFLVRIGGAYEFHFDEYTVSPAVSADILNHEIYWVFGIVFGLSY